MLRKLLGGVALVAAAGLALLGGGPSRAQKPAPLPPPTMRPRLEAVAETRLLMEGLALPNFRGLERLLKEKPDAVEPWTFARGQALLIAETANLLMLRPPHNRKAQAVWFARAASLRDAAREMARSAGARDYQRSRATFVRLANACNHCHQSFRKAVEIVPFEGPAAKEK